MTESQRIAAAAAPVTIEDSLGRQLEVKRLSRRELMRYMRQWGEASNITNWFGQAIIAVTVVSLDGKPVPQATTVDRVEATVDMLGAEGFDAVAQWLAAQGETEEKELRAAAKN